MATAYCSYKLFGSLVRGLLWYLWERWLGLGVSDGVAELKVVFCNCWEFLGILNRDASVFVL